MKTLKTLLLSIALAGLGSLPTQADMYTVSGYTGTQTFTIGSSGMYSGEPLPGGVACDHSDWFSYTAPTNGQLSFDTFSSTYDTVMAIYIDDGLNNGYASLHSVVWNDNAASTVQSSVTTLCTNAVTYYIQVCHKTGGTWGTYSLNLNWNLVAPDFTVTHSGTIVTFYVAPVPPGAWVKWDYYSAVGGYMGTSTTTSFHPAIPYPGTWTIIGTDHWGNTRTRTDYVQDNGNMMSPPEE